MKTAVMVAMLAVLFGVGCDDAPGVPGVSGDCKDSVKILTPNPASSAAVEHVCSRGSKLKVTDKDQSLVAVCKCPENVPHSAPDAGVEDKKEEKK